MDTTNTPRRVTRASMAALSASKNTPTPSPALKKQTPARLTGKKEVKKPTPAKSTGKRGRPRKTNIDSEAKENIPASETKKAEGGRRFLHFVPKEVNSIGDKFDNPEIGHESEAPIIEIMEASLVNQSIDITTTVENNEAPNQSMVNETKGTFDETLNFSKLEEKVEVKENSTTVPLTESATKDYDEAFENCASVHHDVMIKTGDPGIMIDDNQDLLVNDEKVQESNDKGTKTLPHDSESLQQFDEKKSDHTSNKLQHESNTNKTIHDVVDMEIGSVDKEIFLNKTVDNVENMDVDVPAKVDIEERDAASIPILAEPINESSLNNNDNTDVNFIDTTNTEDEVIARLCAEAANGQMEETLNGTFEIDDSVFGPTVPENAEPIPTPAKPAKQVVLDTIVIEDTPLKPKTPQITVRRPFKKQQNLDVSSFLSVSYVAAEKSILKRRKRSMSTGDIDYSVQERRVKFNSPANMTVEINEIDERMLKSFTETNGRHQRAARRKRSLSDAVYPQTKVETAKRTFKSKKMPDFAAIHSKQFNKMEGIAENLQRKQERALYLTTPDGVKTGAGDQKKESGSSKKKQLEFPQNVASFHPETESAFEAKEHMESEVSEEQAVQEINVELPTVESEIEKTDTQKDEEIVECEPVPTSTQSNDVLKANEQMSKKPLAAVAPRKSIEKVQFKHKIQFAGTRPTKAEGQKTPVFKFGAKSTLADIKQGKEVSVKPVKLLERMHNATVAPSSTHDSSTIELPKGNRTGIKLKQNREEQHRNMYKANRSCINERRTGILKGVRLNKRFELQMAFRNMKKE